VFTNPDFSERHVEVVKVEPNITVKVLFKFTK